MATPSTQVFTTTTVFATEKVKDGEWKISEIKSDSPLDQDLHSGNRKEIHFDLGFGIGVSCFSSLPAFSRLSPQNSFFFIERKD